MTATERRAAVKTAVRKLMVESGCDYDTCFAAVMATEGAQLAGQPSPQIANEVTPATMSPAGVELQKLVKELMDTFGIGYNVAFDQACKQRGDLLAQMKTPYRSPEIKWSANRSDGLTPPRQNQKGAAASSTMGNKPGVGLLQK